MKIPFTLIDSTTGNYATGKNSFTVKCSVDGGAFNTLQTTITEPDSTVAPGQYCMTGTLPTFTDYASVVISCTGCDSVRKLLYPEPSTVVPPTAQQIADAVWDDAMATAIATQLTTLITDVEKLPEDVLTTDTTSFGVTKNMYTLKHLIMASQKSRVVISGTDTNWEIQDAGGNIIATRKLTLNEKGAIVKTE